jgi:hypothetical protein
MFIGSGGPVWPTATMLPDGRVLIVANNPPEIYDPTTDTFAPTGPMTDDAYRYGMYWHTATSLTDGTALVAGGNDDWTCAGIANAEVYDPSSGTFKVVGTMSTSRDAHTATLLRDGTVLIAGGGSGGCGIPSKDSVELYDPASASFVFVGRMAQDRSGHTATLLSDGSVLIAGGMFWGPGIDLDRSRGALRSAELYRPAKSGPRARGVRR